MNEVKKVTTLNQLVAFCTDSIIDNKKKQNKEGLFLLYHDHL